MIKALLFDLDGTLFDSSPANVRAYSQAFEAAGISFDSQKYESIFGLRFAEMMDVVAPDANEHTRDEIRRLKVDYYQQNLSLVKPNEGLLALLRSSRSHYKTALVTTASAANVTNLLKHFEVEPTLFDIIITGEDVKNGKPDPECYMTAIDRLGITASECCTFEDSEVGVEAAVRAGTQAIRVRI